MTKRINARHSKLGDTARKGENPPWRITAKARVGKTITHHDLSDPAFVPTLRQIIDNLRENPFQYPTKEGPLSDLRGVDLHFNGVKFRLLYQIFKDERIVRLIVLDERKSSRVYKKAKASKRGPRDGDMDIDSR